VPASSAAGSRFMLGEPLRLGLPVWAQPSGSLLGRRPGAHRDVDAANTLELAAGDPGRHVLFVGGILGVEQIPAWREQAGISVDRRPFPLQRDQHRIDLDLVRLPIWLIADVEAPA
jgi:hypothetical protein